MVNTTSQFLSPGRRLAITALLAAIGSALAWTTGRMLGDALLPVVALYLAGLAAWVALADGPRETWKALGLFVLALVVGAGAVLVTGLTLLWMACHSGGCFD
jgi:FtsH-binding integral membrane protein